MTMSFGQAPKFDFARQVAAAVGYVALCGFDRVTVQPFPLGEDQAGLAGELRRVRGRRSSFRFFENLSKLKPGGAADFNQALRHVVRQSPDVILIGAAIYEAVMMRCGFNELRPTLRGVRYGALL